MIFTVTTYSHSLFVVGFTGLFIVNTKIQLANMFNKKKKKPQISLPSNFEHRVHTGFDKREGRYVGLPLQWASIVGNNQILKSTNRPLPLVDPSEITHTEILDLKTIVRPHFNNNKLSPDDTRSSNNIPSVGQVALPNGLALPKTSHVARSNSLRSSSPPRMRRDLRGNANVPPSVPEETPLPNTNSLQLGTDSIIPAIDSLPRQLASGNTQQQQFPNMRRDPTAAGIPAQANYSTKPTNSMNQPHTVDWNRPIHAQGNDDKKGHNENSMALIGVANSIPMHTEMPAPYFR